MYFTTATKLFDVRPVQLGLQRSPLPRLCAVLSTLSRLDVCFFGFKLYSIILFLCVSVWFWFRLCRNSCAWQIRNETMQNSYHQWVPVLDLFCNCRIRWKWKRTFVFCFVKVRLFCAKFVKRDNRETDPKAESEILVFTFQFEFSGCRFEKGECVRVCQDWLYSFSPSEPGYWVRKLVAIGSVMNWQDSIVGLYEYIFHRTISVFAFHGAPFCWSVSVSCIFLVFTPGCVLAFG